MRRSMVVMGSFFMTCILGICAWVYATTPSVTLIGPTNGITLTGLNVTLIASGYDVDKLTEATVTVYRNNNPQDTVQVQTTPFYVPATTIPSLVLQLSGQIINQNGTYYWNVKLKDTLNNQVTSETRTFIVNSASSGGNQFQCNVSNCNSCSANNYCATNGCNTGFNRTNGTCTQGISCNVANCNSCSANNYCGTNGCNNGYTRNNGTCTVTTLSGFLGSISFSSSDVQIIDNKIYTRKNPILAIINGNQMVPYTILGDITTQVNDTLPQALTKSNTITLTSIQGTKYVAVQFSYNNQSYVTGKNITLDSTAPTKPVLTSPINMQNVTGPFSLSRTPSIENGAGILAYNYVLSTDPNFNSILQSGQATSTSAPIDYNSLQPGTYYRRVTAWDKAGNSSVSDQGSFTIGATTTPTADNCPNGDYSSSTYDGTCGTKPATADNCPDGDYSSSMYDGTCGTKPTTNSCSAQPTYTDPSCYLSQELIGAYTYACNLGATTQPSIDSANMCGAVIRKELAKMMSVYATTVLGMVPDTSRSCIFGDMFGESDEMRRYAVMACQLGIMGLEYDGRPAKFFDPNLNVDRGTFGTAFSRMIYGSRYNGDAEVRYRPHLNALKQATIMNSISNPFMLEQRGYVMLMMQRASTLR